MSGINVDENCLFQDSADDFFQIVPSPVSIIYQCFPRPARYDTQPSTFFPLDVYGNYPIGLNVQLWTQAYYGVKVWKLTCNGTDLFIDMADTLTALNLSPVADTLVSNQVYPYQISGASGTDFGVVINIGQATGSGDVNMFVDDDENFYPLLSFEYSDGTNTSSTNNNFGDPAVGTFTWMGQDAEIRGTAASGDVTLIPDTFW